jgi:hypothetical protein
MMSIIGALAFAGLVGLGMADEANGKNQLATCITVSNIAGDVQATRMKTGDTVDEMMSTITKLNPEAPNLGIVLVTISSVYHTIDATMPPTMVTSLALERCMEALSIQERSLIPEAKVEYAL